MGNKQQRSSENESVGPPQASANVVPAVHRVVADAAGSVVGAVGALGAEEREALRVEKDENWWRVHESDTLRTLSEKHLGDPSLWPHLHAGCRRELGKDPNNLMPGSHLTQTCVDRARRRAERNARWWQFWI